MRLVKQKEAGRQREQGQAGQKPGGICHVRTPTQPRVRSGVWTLPSVPQPRVPLQAGTHPPTKGVEPGPPRSVIQLLTGSFNFIA